MKREIVKIDRDKCNGCGLCIPNCHEGALQMIDGKATLISELMCDGLGACLGHCPQEAIIIEFREAQPYNEIEVIKEMIPHGKNVIIAHLTHLKEHHQTEFLHQAVLYLKEKQPEITFNVDEIIQKVHHHTTNSNSNQKKQSMEQDQNQRHECGCPGAKEMSFDNEKEEVNCGKVPSQLRQWPVQLHLINPAASYFQQADLLVAADCVAYSLGNFHQSYLKEKSLVIACPKLDAGQEVYLDKLIRLINQAKVNTITVMIMEVPCCHGLLQMVIKALESAGRKVPVKRVVVGIQGEILEEEWV
jgi:NAD-dependent dihydropyrimidine dehydrogenase PreA subunit